MKPALVLAAATAAVALTGAIAQADAPSAAATPTTVASCDQHVAVGKYTCFALKRTDLAQPRVLAAGATPAGLGPSDLVSAYHLPSADTTATVAIVDAFDDPSAEADLATYRAQYGLPPCTTDNGCFRKLNQRGDAAPLPSPDAGWAAEISLDLDMVSATCPSCHITLIEADDNSADNLFSAVKLATDLGIKYVSMSFGGPESGMEADFDAEYFESSGVVYTASSGDYGYGAGPIYPSTSQHVVSVGGTSLTRAGNTRGWTESAWAGAGSGCSTDEPKPEWQSIVAGSVCEHRADSDVSAVADPATGVAVYQTYGGNGWAVYGGTSASAPIIASVYALAGTPRADDQPASYPYARTADLNDVTSGDNGQCSAAVMCTAGTGWDGPTGLGTPNGVTAFKAGNKISVTNPGPQIGTVGTAVSLQIKATDSASSATLAYHASGLPTGLSIDADSGLISGTPTEGAVATVTVTATDDTGASGKATFTWTIDGTGTGCTGQVLLNPGFESGSAAWTADAGVINTDGAYAHTARGYAWLDGYGIKHDAALTQHVRIPAGCTATLGYDLWVTSYERTSQVRDTLTVTVNGKAVQTFSNADRGSGYEQRSLDLSGYAGKTVTITWTGSENASYATSFFVDDTALTLG